MSSGGTSGLTRVTFTVRAETALGETIRVTGDTKFLGHFKPKYGLELVTTPQEYPVWRTNRPVTLPRGVPLFYKYVVFSGGYFDHWEGIGAQTRMIIPKGPEMVVHDVMGKYEGYLEQFCDSEAAEEDSSKSDLGGSVDSAAFRHPHVRFDIATSSEAQSECSIMDSMASSVDDLDHSVEESQQESILKSYEMTVNCKYRLLLVSFGLPVLLKYRPEKPQGSRWSADWDQDSVSRKTEGSVANDHQVTWMGAITPEMVIHDDIELVWKLTPQDREEITQILTEMSCIPIFLERAVYVTHFVRSCLLRYRNIFHNVLNVRLGMEDLVVDPDDPFSQEKYKGFVHGSNIFVDAIMNWVEDSTGEMRDLVWIHNYPLMLVPRLLRQRCAEKARVAPKMVFFLHIPFPTSEIFRTLSVREDLLLGILGADMVGFHTFDHARHFISSCRRYLGLQIHSIQGGRLTVKHEGRAMVVLISHVGIEKAMLEASLASSKFTRYYEHVKSSYPDKIIITGMDVPERLQGIPLKLLAFERLLGEFPKWRSKVVFVQHGLLTVRDSLYKSFYPEDDGTMMGISACVTEIRLLCERINRKYGNVCFFKTYAPFQWPSPEERCAIWSASRVYMHTPVMEGLNLLPLEYTYAARNPAGIVIISEFCAASKVLNGAIRINCYDMDEMSKSLDFALSRTEAESSVRRERDVQFISDRSSAMWTRNILRELEADTDAAVADLDEADRDTTNDSNASPIGFRVYERRCQPLPRTMLLSRYAKSKRRLIFLDDTGTVTTQEASNRFVKHDFAEYMQKLSPETVNILKRLCSDPLNSVYVISSDSIDVVSTRFADISQEYHLGMIASSGVAIRKGYQKRLSNMVEPTRDEFAPPSTPRKSNEWEYLLDGIEDSWTDWLDAAKIPAILDNYTWRTAGSGWSKTSVSATWYFRQADPEWGNIQAQMLEEDLVQAIDEVNVPLNVFRHGLKVDLHPRGIDKGSAVKYIWEEFIREQECSPDFVLAIGHDSSDEPVFTQILNSVSVCDDESDHEQYDGVFTCIVGKKTAAAQYYLESVEDTRLLLQELTQEN